MKEIFRDGWIEGTNIKLNEGTLVFVRHMFWPQKNVQKMHKYATKKTLNLTDETHVLTLLQMSNNDHQRCRTAAADT